MELLEIKKFVMEMQEGQKMIYFAIILGEMNKLIDNFIECSVPQQPNMALILDKGKDIIINFDKLRADYISKLKKNDKLQILSNESILILNKIFGSIRFILTRFGRFINYYDALESYYRRKTMKVSINFANPIMSISKAEASFQIDID